METKETREKDEAIDSLLKACIKKGNIFKVQEVVRLRGREPSKEEIDSLVSTCLKQRRLYSAREAAKLAGRELTAKEIGFLIEACIKEGRIDDDVLEVAELTGRELATEEIDALVNNCIINEEKRGDALRTATKLGASRETIDSLVGPYIEMGFFTEAKKAAELVGRAISTKEAEAMLKVCFKYGWADSISGVVKLLGRELTTEEIDTLIEACAKRGPDYQLSLCLEMAKARGLKKAIESITRIYIKAGKIDDVAKAAKPVERELTIEEIDLLLKACVKRGSIYESCLKKDAFRVAKLGASKEAIESLVGACIEKGWISEAQEAAKLAGRELTAEEIGKFVETI